MARNPAVRSGTAGEGAAGTELSSGAARPLRRRAARAVPAPGVPSTAFFPAASPTHPSAAACSVRPCTECSRLIPPPPAPKLSQEPQTFPRTWVCPVVPKHTLQDSAASKSALAASGEGKHGEGHLCPTLSYPCYPNPEAATAREATGCTYGQEGMDRQDSI